MRPVPQITLGGAYRYRYDASLLGSDAANAAGDCEAPYTVELRGVESLLRKQLATVHDDPFVDWIYEDGQVRFLPGRAPDAPAPPKVLTVYVKVRCRKCDKCLWHKRRLWTARAITEVRSACRTWFGTLTVGPDRRFWAKAKASQTVARRRAEDWDMLSASERTKAIARELSPEVTRWLKRVRKESGAPLRYLLVIEPHKDDFPHFHLLLHELGQPIPKRLLERQWNWGFSSWKLLDQFNVTGVRYACKYLTKSVQTRIRASRKYGQADVGQITERLESVTRACEEEKRLSERTTLSVTRKAKF